MKSKEAPTLYELSNREVIVLQAACAVAQDQMAENTESAKRCAKNCHLPMSDRDSAARVAKWYQEWAAAFEAVSKALDNGRELTTLAAHGDCGAPDAAAVGAFAVGGVTVQRYAIVIYDKRTGDVFTTLMQAEDGAAAVAAMNRKDWGTSLMPLSLILLPKRD